MRSVAGISALLAAALVLMSITSAAQQQEPGDRTLSPYFFVKSDDQDPDRLPLKSTSAAVNIVGVIADVKVVQVYRNEGKNAIEAIYVFPASTRAAVYAMKMTIGERVVVAKIKKRGEARQEYEQAKGEGKSASLLEQQRPNVFQMNVANIMPGDEIKVELSYTELLVPADREYEFIYPAVVGPRYSNEKAEATPPSERWAQNPYLRQGEAPTYDFGVMVNIHAGMPLRKLSCVSHKTSVRYSGPSSATVALDESETRGGNRDYVLRYRLAGDQVESGLLLYPGEKENFFLLILQPPKRVTASQIPGREYIFIVDVSGSMYGYPLEISKKLLKDLIGGLRPTDRFNVLLFAGGSTLMSGQSLPATAKNISRAVATIDGQGGGGATELLPALRRALALPRPEGFSRTVVIATDGYVQVEEQAFDLIRNNLGDANMFTFGIGTAVNRHLIEGMARAGMGEPFVITKPEEAPAKAEAFRALIQSPVLTRIKVQFEGFETYDVEPHAVPDVLADRPVVLFGKWRGKPRGTITLSGITGEKPYAGAVDVGAVRPLKSNSALQHLWARHRITLLSDYNMLRQDDGRVKEVTDLGLAYNLLTSYTSFVAIDSEARNTSGKSTVVSQPLPLPEGVSDYAVAGYASAPPAPRMMLSRKAAAAEAPARYESKSEDKAVRKDAGSSVKISEVAAAGGLSRDAVRKTVEKQVMALRSCFPAAPQSMKFKVKLTIDAGGAVQNIEIAPSGTVDKAVEQCLLRAIKGWRFGPNSAGKNTEASITFAVGA